MGLQRIKQNWAMNTQHMTFSSMPHLCLFPDLSLCHALSVALPVLYSPILSEDTFYCVPAEGIRAILLEAHQWPASFQCFPSLLPYPQPFQSYPDRNQHLSPKLLFQNPPRWPWSPCLKTQGDCVRKSLNSESTSSKFYHSNIGHAIFSTLLLSNL